VSNPVRSQPSARHSFSIKRATSVSVLNVPLLIFFSMTSVMCAVIAHAFLVQAISYSSFTARIAATAWCIPCSLQWVSHPSSASMYFKKSGYGVHGSSSTTDLSSKFRVFRTARAAFTLSRPYRVYGSMVHKCACCSASASSHGMRKEPSVVRMKSPSPAKPVRYLIEGSRRSSQSSNIIAEILFFFISSTTL